MKNQARLHYKGERFLVWQDGNSNWYFSYGNLQDVNTGHKELQPALNGIYETLDETLDENISPMGRRPKKNKGDWKPKKKEPINLLDRLGLN